MKYPIFLGVLLVLALILTACGPAATATEPPVTMAPTEPPMEATATTETQPTTEATSTGSVSETGTPSAGTGTGTSGIPVTGEVTVMAPRMQLMVLSW